MSLQSLTPRIALLLTLPPLRWAGNAVIGRIAIDHIPPLTLNAARWALALLLLLPLGWRVLATAERRAQVAARWRYLSLIGLLGVGAYNALQYMALRTSTPLNVTLIAASMPVGMLVVGGLFFGEKPRPVQWSGAALSLLGVAVVLGRGELATLLRVQFVIGDLLIFAAMLGWAFYGWVLAKPPAHMQGSQKPDFNWAELLWLQIAFGWLWALAFAATGEWIAPSPQPIAWSPLLVAVLLYVAICPSLIAYRAWGLGVAAVGPTVASFVSNLTPLFAACLSAAVLGEWPQMYHGVAFALIVAGIGVSSRR